MPRNSSFSVIVPVYQEADNIPELINRIANIKVGECSFEVILVDDNSQDGTIEIVKKLSLYYPWLKLIVREVNRGLSRSVVEGFAAANYPLLILMDADLSHPPEKIPEMLAQLEKSDVEMVIGSRYIQGGVIDEVWPFYRKIISKLTAYMARLVLSSKVLDPLSGFIGISKKTYLTAADRMNPVGWKISLELMVKCHCKNIIEVPINFAQRHSGKSKLNLNVGIDYLKQIKQLFMYKYLERL